MSKFVGIKTYERFRSLWENDAIDEFSLNFIIDTGLLYTHGIFINGAEFGTAANGAVPLSIAGITNTLALSTHTHSNYLEKNADIDISSYKIKSGDKDLLFYSGGSLYLGNITSPTYISGNNLHSVRGTNVYDILDTSNFSVSNTLPTGYTYNNTAYIKYGNNSHQIDYIKRINTSLSFDYLNTYTLAGTNLLNGVQYGYITLYTDNVYTNPSWAQLRINIPGKAIQYRTSADANTWISIDLPNIPLNALNVAGIVAAPSSTTTNKVWKTDGSGNPAWRDELSYTFSNLKFLLISGTDLMTYNTLAVRTILAGSNISFTHNNGVLTIQAQDTTYGVVSKTSAGLAPQLPNETTTTKFLRQDGTWAIPTYTSDTNTWREIKVNGTQKRSTAITSGDLNFINGSNTTVEWTSDNKLKINSTWTAWKGATDSANGTAGYMPAPTSALRGQFLRGDGSWVSLNNYSLPTASNTTLGGVKTGAAVTDTTGMTAVHIKDGVIYYKDTNTTYSFSNLLFLQTSGTNLMTYNSQAARTVLAGSNITFTHSNNILTIAAKDTTYSTVSKTAAGLCPILPNETTTTKYLRLDGTWATPPDNNTWNAANASQAGYVPKSTANKILRANADGALYWGDDANTTYTFYNLQFQNSGGTTVDTYKPTTSPTKTLKAGANVTISAASNVITIASTDTNTWRGILNNLTSDSTTDSLSAAQGKALNGKFANYLPLSGGTMTGNITMGTNSIVFNQDTTSSWNVAANTGIMLLNTVGASATGAPGTYHIGLSVSGYYGFQLATYGGGGTRLLFRNTSRESYPSWSEIAYLSDVTWATVTSKPETATRWPSWSEVTSKPSTFTPSSHTHNYIEAKGNYTFTSSNLPNTFDLGISAGFVNSNSGFGSYGSVLTVRTYSGGGGTLLLYAPYSNTYGGSHLKARFGDYETNSGNSWTTLKTVAWLDDIPSSLPANGGNADTVDNQHFKWSNDSNSPTYLWAANSSGTAFLCARGSMSVNYANYSGYSNKVLGSYTSNGGQLNPNYFGTNRVGFLMMNTTVNGNSQYKDWVIMDCYSGSDVGGGVAIGVNRQALGAYIMRSAAERTSWAESAELCGTHNSSVSLSGSTLTVKIAGTSQSLTNTWRGIQNNLTSDSTTDSLSAALGKALANGSARDSTKLPLAGGTMTGSITMSQGASARNVGIIGTYDYTKAAAIWTMGASYQISAAGNSLGSLYGAAYVYLGLAGQGTMAGGHQFVWAENGVAKVALGNAGVWTTGGFKKNGSSDSYVLLGGGGHKAVSDFATSEHNHNSSYVASVSISGNNLRINKNGANTDLTIPYATNAGSATSATKFGGYYSENFMVFENTNENYVNASFPNLDYSAKAHQKYIEFWDGGNRDDTGWFNFKLGNLHAVEGVFVGNNPVIHSGNIGSQSVNYATTAGNVTGVVAIANGGTGASTRLNALKNLTNENVSTNAQYFLTITSSWGKGGYTSVADAKTVLAMTGATSSANGTAGVVSAPPKDGYNTKFLRADGTWSVPAYPTKASWNYDDVYLKLLGGTMTGGITFNTGGNSTVGIKLVYNNTSGGSAFNQMSVSMPDDTVVYRISTLFSGTTFRYGFIGTGLYNDSNNLRIYPDHPAWGDNTIWHGGNDGSGSGLDADMLDGLHSNEFPIMSLNGATELTSGGTCDLTNVGTYYTTSKAISASLTNTPFTESNFRLWHFKTGLTNYPAQLAISFCEGMAMRGKNNTAWYDWKYSVFKDGNGDITDVGAVSASGNYVITKSSGATKFAVVNNKGSVELITQTNRGVYERTNEKWLIGTNGTNTWLSCGNVAIASSANTTYKLYVDGTIGATGNTTLGGTLDVTGATTLSSYLTVAGNLGVGTTSPSYALDVVGSARTKLMYFYNRANTANAGYIGAGSSSVDYIYFQAYTNNGLYMGANNGFDLVILPDHNVGVGTTEPSYKMHVNGNVGASNFYTTSDRSKKLNISSFSEHISKFQLKDTEKWHYGVIAQEVPEMFRDGKEGNMTVNYNSVLSYYVGCLENRVKELEDKLAKYEELKNK